MLCNGEKKLLFEDELMHGPSGQLPFDVCVLRWQTADRTAPPRNWNARGTTTALNQLGMLEPDGIKMGGHSPQLLKSSFR